MAAPDVEALAQDAAGALAADIICSLRGADLAGWTPPWCKPAPSPALQGGEPVWPAVVRGKRSRRRSPPSVGTASGKGRWGRGSPASPLDYSGGSGSGASTSGVEDGGFCSPPVTTSKVRYSISATRTHFLFVFPALWLEDGGQRWISRFVCRA
jgi:hypothetical protein